MKREGFWRYATPPVTFFGIPLPFLLLYLVWFRWPSMKTLYICSAILGFFVALNFFGWSLRSICFRLISTFRAKIASVRTCW
uniref:conjugal transfer protein n=1 Tax=Enterobacter hormaechei TaxID=158836 RepID=UPI000BB7F3DB